jgi:hypothetical protein
VSATPSPPGTGCDRGWTRAPAAARSRPGGARLLSGALTAALILLVAAGARPARQTARQTADAHAPLLAPLAAPATATAGQAQRAVGPGGASGWGQLGAGGAEGTTGAHGRGETASDYRSDAAAAATATARAG